MRTSENEVGTINKSTMLLGGAISTAPSQETIAKNTKVTIIGTCSLYFVVKVPSGAWGYVYKADVDVKIKNLKMSAQNLHLSVGGTYSKLHVYDILPTYATNKNMIWYSDNPNIATVTTNKTGNVTVTALKKGTTFIVAKAEDGGGAYVTCNIEVKQLVTGIEWQWPSIECWIGDWDINPWTVLPTNADNKTVKWSSSNTSVATVYQDGWVYANRAGTSTIKAEATDGSGVFATYPFYVIGATGVSVSPSSLTMTKGETKQLDGSVSYFGNYPGYSWSSNNTNIATVDGAGNVKAIAAGSAKITLTSGTLSASCTVTVKAAATGGSSGGNSGNSGGNSGTKPPAATQPATQKPATSNNASKITSITPFFSKVRVLKGGQSTVAYTLNPPFNINKNINWSTENKKIATVESSWIPDNIVINGVNTGTVTITGKAADGGGATVNITVTVVDNYVALAQNTGHPKGWFASRVPPEIEPIGQFLDGMADVMDERLSGIGTFLSEAFLALICRSDKYLTILDFTIGTIGDFLNNLPAPWDILFHLNDTLYYLIFGNAYQRGYAFGTIFLFVVDILITKAIAEGLTTLAEKFGIVEKAVAATSLTTAEIEGYARLAINAGRAESKEVVLGKLIESSKLSYERIAEYRGATYFYLENWQEIFDEIGYENMLKINKKFIDVQINEGKYFTLVSDPKDATGFFAEEIKYLNGKGYKNIKKSGEYWTITK